MPSFPPFGGRTEGFCLEMTGREVDLTGHLRRKPEGMVLKNGGVSAFACRGVPVVYSSHVGGQIPGHGERSSTAESSSDVI